HYIGKFYIADISIPKQLLNSPDFKVNLTTENFVGSKLPARPGSSNKSSFGKALLICGSKLYCGAAKIARNALLRSGAGISFVMVPDSILSETQSDNTDAITIGLKSSKDGYIKASLENIESVLEFISINKITAVGLGMGMTDTEDTSAFVGELLSKIKVPVCLDADGLHGLKKHKEKILANRELKLVITPHTGEMASLIDCQPENVLMDRLNISRNFSSENNCVTLLKGHRTIICDPTGKTYINTSGNPAMAKGGMGDALAGLITGFLALGMTQMDAAVCACYIHGKAGDLALANVFEYSMTTGDLIGKISEAMATVTGRNKK
ncbi:MAG TPA: NAD(P)H-hydrate dehydratase, partial [Candidatus Wallbacteria bacterium]|nr:NAD(P)H-hydrate dehydratase [Candidatus Wallbacteria bacterium]